MQSTPSLRRRASRKIGNKPSAPTYGVLLPTNESSSESIERIPETDTQHGLNWNLRWDRQSSGSGGRWAVPHSFDGDANDVTYVADKYPTEREPFGYGSPRDACDKYARLNAPLQKCDRVKERAGSVHRKDALIRLLVRIFD